MMSSTQNVETVMSALVIIKLRHNAESNLGMLVFNHAITYEQLCKLSQIENVYFGITTQCHAALP